MTRIGFYIIQNGRNTLVHTVDVPWDFGTNAEDGTMIKPNPIPQEPEETVGFKWNIIAAERTIFYIRKRLFWHPNLPIEEIHPYRLRYATFMMSFELAEKLSIISVEDKELMENNYRPYSLEFPDINSVIYLTKDFSPDDEPIGNNVKVITKSNSYYYTFEDGEIPDFSNPDYPIEPDVPEPPQNPDIDPNDPEAGIDPHDGGDIEMPSDPFEVDEEKLLSILSGLLDFNEDKKHTIFIPFYEAIDSKVLVEIGIESIRESYYESLIWIYYYNGNKIVFTEQTDEVLVLPFVEDGTLRITLKDDELSILTKKKPNNNEKFIHWFKDYFYLELLRDPNFLNKFNMQRGYIIISQENKDIMGVMRLYKGSSYINFMQHNWKVLVENQFPNIRDKMVFKDDSFGGFDEDEDYQQDYEPNVDGEFGGFDDDKGFLI